MLTVPKNNICHFTCNCWLFLVALPLKSGLLGFPGDPASLQQATPCCRTKQDEMSGKDYSKRQRLLKTGCCAGVFLFSPARWVSLVQRNEARRLFPFGYLSHQDGGAVSSSKHLKDIHRCAFGAFGCSTNTAVLIEDDLAECRHLYGAYCPHL